MVIKVNQMATAKPSFCLIVERNSFHVNTTSPAKVSRTKNK